MRLGIVVAIVLGLVAALFAAVLVRGMLADRGQTAGAQEVSVVVATGEYPSMTVLTADSVKMKTVPAKGLDPGHLTDVSLAIGRILGTSVQAEQILTPGFFIENSSAAHVAASLPEGMRAVTITMNQSMITGGLLYPGSVVDVLVAFDIRGSREGGQALSTILLRAIQVLAVQAKSVASKQEQQADGQSSSSGPLTVTMMVDPKQAEALQLATVHGTISLALRNPLDKLPVDTEPTILNQGRMAQVGLTMPSAVEADETARANPPIVLGPGETPEAVEPPAPRPPVWPVTLIKGSTSAVLDFEGKQG